MCPFRVDIPVKSSDSAAISRKCGEKTPFLSPHRNHPGTPHLWPHLAEIARLAKTALSP
jgi:hypothetical protein